MIRVLIIILFLLLTVGVLSFENRNPVIFWSKVRYYSMNVLGCTKVDKNYFMRSGGGVYSEWECREN